MLENVFSKPQHKSSPSSFGIFRNRVKYIESCITRIEFGIAERELE